ncbi:MAG: histidine kinase [Bacteroidetes bacterium]|nr:histidine kinase [Bacteroidota bacterium]
MLNQVNDIVATLIAVTFLLFGLFVFIIVFAFLFQRRQQKHKLEKAALQAQFEQEILNAENEIQDSTMKHISRELHDNVSQLLTLAKIHLNNLGADLPGNSRIEDSKGALNQALTDIRALSKTLNSDNILIEGLAKAIEFELSRAEKLGIFKVNFQSKPGGSPALNPQKEILVFRIFQELLQNAIKHSQAKNIKVNLEEHPEHLNLEVIDDGIGFDVDAVNLQSGFASGAGIGNLIHRAKLMNGSLHFENPAVGGLKVTLSIPY